MKIEVLADPNAVAERAAALIAGEARTAIAARKRFVMAVSGGHTPWIMLNALAGQDVSWSDVHVFQVKPDGHTASLMPDDPDLQVTGTTVGLTGEYQSRRHMTLIYTILNHAKRIVLADLAVAGSRRNGT
jgi:6-phosphogluconolactonase/glucosamine-6-phosphate isomerase/deaminase